MRALLTLLVVVVIVVLVGVMTGFLNFSGRSGALPKVAVEGGKMPSVAADVGTVDVGTKNSTIEVPKIETSKETVKLPTVDVKKANEK